QDLPKLTYARQVFLEILRLYPPVPTVTRNAIEADEVDGIRIAAGDLVVLVPYMTHRHPAYWPMPNRFDPDRFAADRFDSIEPYSSLPFLLGRRQCLGEHFAMIEGPLLLAMIARRYKLTMSSSEPIATRPISTLRLSRPLVMHVTSRV